MCFHYFFILEKISKFSCYLLTREYQVARKKKYMNFVTEIIFGTNLFLNIIFVICFTNDVVFTPFKDHDIIYFNKCEMISAKFYLFHLSCEFMLGSYNNTKKCTISNSHFVVVVITIIYINLLIYFCIFFSNRILIKKVSVSSSTIFITTLSQFSPRVQTFSADSTKIVTRVVKKFSIIIFIRKKF